MGKSDSITKEQEEALRLASGPVRSDPDELGVKFDPFGGGQIKRDLEPTPPLITRHHVDELGLGTKFDDDKVDWDLLPMNAIEAVVKVLMFGAKVHGRCNWQRLENFERRYYNATMRHMKDWHEGIRMDTGEGGTNQPVLANTACDVLFLLERELALEHGIGDTERFER